MTSRRPAKTAIGMRTVINIAVFIAEEEAVELPPAPPAGVVVPAAAVVIAPAAVVPAPEAAVLPPVTVLVLA